VDYDDRWMSFRDQFDIFHMSGFSPWSDHIPIEQRFVAENCFSD
jgi:hypothetical protein